MSQNNNIPKHWQLKKLGEVFIIERGGSPRPIEEFLTNDVNGINWIKIGDTKDVVKYIYKTKEKIKPEGAFRSRMVYEDDFLLSNSMSFGRPYIMKTTGCIHDGWLVIRKNEIVDNNYLYYILSSPLLYQQFTNLAKGSTVKNLNIEAVKQAIIKFPPLPEQQAIVSKIEALLSELENGKQQLLTAQQQLKVYRQSLLKWAFEGKLGCLNHDLLNSPDDPDFKKINSCNQENHNNQGLDKGELPKGWKWVKLSDLGTWKGGGTPSKRVNMYWENGTNLWVTSKDMKIGVINDSKNKITDEAILYSSAKKIPKGAILFVMRSGILRHTFPVAIAGKDLTVNQDLLTLHPNGLATSEFIYWFIRAFNNEIRQKCSKDGTTVESIESNSLKNYPFILPPLLEQHLIVSELESKLTVCDKLAETISQSLQQAETLRQSILKKAFEGKLVNFKHGL